MHGSRQSEATTDDLVVEAKQLSKGFVGTASSGYVEALDGVSISIRRGEVVTLFGPNGCGKTTLLNMLAGVVKPDSGEIFRADTPRKAASVGFVFQNYADTLLPWRTVRGNLEFPLEVQSLSREGRSQIVRSVLGRFRLTEHADKYVYELSGGLKQLVAIAQATIYEPILLLLDEPFSSLDFSVSRDFWLRFRAEWRSSTAATLVVSHNADEAVFLGDRVYVLSARPGRIVAEIAVPFGDTRGADLLTSRTFFEVRKQVLDAFESGMRL